MKKATLFLLLVTASFSKALPPYPPQTPPYPPQRQILPQTGYFLFGWDTTAGSGMGAPKSLNPNLVPVAARANIVKIVGGISTSGNNSCAPPGPGNGLAAVLNVSGRVTVFQTGMPTTYEYCVPEEAKNNVVDLYIFDGFVYAIKNTGKLLLWQGTGNNGELSNLPSELQSGIVNVSASSGDSNFLALKETGEVFAYQKSSITVTNTTPAGMPFMMTTNVWSQMPVPQAVQTDVVQIWGQGSFAAGPLYALKKDGSLIAWSCTGGIVEEYEMPEEVKTGIAKIVKDGLVLMKNGKAIKWKRNATWNGVGQKFLVNILRDNEADVVDVGYNDQTVTSDVYVLTRNGVVYGWDTNFNPLALNSELSEGVNEIYIKYGWNSALKNNGKVLRWSYPTDNLDTSLPVETYTSVPSLSEIGGASTLFLSSSGEVAVSVYCGLPLDVLADLVAEKIRNTPTNYGIATKTNLQTFLNETVSNLATKTELNTSLSQSRADGINTVLSNPNLWTLYTTNQIKALAIGDLVLSRTNNGEFVLNYDIEQSEDLVNWSPYQGFAMPLTNLPTNKAFVRIKAKQ